MTHVNILGLIRAQKGSLSFNDWRTSAALDLTTTGSRQHFKSSSKVPLLPLISTDINQTA